MDDHETGILCDDHKTMNQPMQLTRDEFYYFQHVVFRVGNTLFRVPKILFDVPGTTFEVMFTLPPPTDVEPEGSSDDNPIVLNVDEKDFRSFLRVICGSRLRAQKLTDEDWLSALDLATMWNFDDVRHRAIQTLDKWSKTQSLKQVILTAKKYNIVPWLKFAYTQLVSDPYEALPFDELTSPPAVDWETISRLLYIKHQHAVVAHVNFRSRADEIVKPMVENMFKGEFNEPVIIEDYSK